MSICPNPELYSAYVDNEVSESLKEEVETHISNCKDCRSLVNKYRKISEFLIYDNEPELNLDISFKRLTIKRSKSKLNSYLVFLCFLKSRAKVLITSTFCLFACILIFTISQSNIMEKTDSYRANQKSADFIPILPISYGAQKKLNLKEIDIHNINMFITSDKKYNRKVYGNFINTFNNFSYLYSRLNEEDHGFIDIKNPITNSNQYIYTSNIQIYTNLNRNAK